MFSPFLVLSPSFSLHHVRRRQEEGLLKIRKRTHQFWHPNLKVMRKECLLFVPLKLSHILLWQPTTLTQATALATSRAYIPGDSYAFCLTSSKT
jgi:hypothetical protein